jgi:hypothetical protein
VAGLFGMPHENDRRSRLRLKKPRETDRDCRVDDEDLYAARSAHPATILFFLAPHGQRLYEFLGFLTT